MSTIDTILKPFKFVENEVESVVAKVYEVYHDKTGDDQYGLSGHYLTGAFIYSSASVILDLGISSEAALATVFFGAVNYGTDRNNKSNRKLDQETSNSPELVKNRIREINRTIQKFTGRALLLASLDVISYETTNYSILCNYIQSLPNNVGNNQSLAFATLALPLMTLAAYTSCIDSNRPVKSKLAAKIKGLFHQSKLATAGVKE